MKGAPKLLHNLLDALRAYEADTELQEVLGTPFSAACSKLKHDAWNAITSHFTAWEHETTLAEPALPQAGSIFSLREAIN